MVRWRMAECEGKAAAVAEGRAVWIHAVMYTHIHTGRESGREG